MERRLTRMIQVNLYTDGGKFFYDSSVIEYVGYYNVETIEGFSDPIVFSGRSREVDSYRLIPIPIDIEKYKNAGGKDVPDPLVIITPVPSEQDYNREWFNRYFARKANDTTAQYHEIDKDQYERVIGKSMPFYTAVQLRWKISGPEKDVLNAVGDIIEPGVSNTNNRSIKSVELQHPGLVFRLQNHTEFWDKKTSAYFGPPLKLNLEVQDKNVAE